jgi:hypothetical protein
MKGVEIEEVRSEKRKHAKKIFAIINIKKSTNCALSQYLLFL